ncbi:fructosamine kinase family protein [Brachybacterium sp. EF45031]|uniref:fructosamine kinase family protein n=1 Tax=Brachybacterium sillae TaxID=2810536 RepID=UPI00217D5522|nr:fructosamine kinase family protein [Brachybacterium sillae]MCS6712172.1 fructosamine kinase family protein [Brachybacterium sillae]
MVATDVFLKERPDGLEGFLTREADGLRRLAAAGARVPQVRSVDATRLVIDRIDATGRRTPETEEAFGRELAQLHRRTARPGPYGDPERPVAWLGEAPIDLTPCSTWTESWVGRRIVPLAEQAHRAGNLPAAAVRDAHRLAELTVGVDPEAPVVVAVLGPPEPPSLLHGDLWAGNRLLDPQGRSWLIDPSIQYGHREVDLAMMRLFGGFGEQAFAAYDAAFPLAAGWEQRVLPYQAVPLLVHALLFGGGYGAQAARSLAAAVARG